MYSVFGMKLIPQQRNMGCWYGSAQMLIQWKRNKGQMTTAGHFDPSEVASTVAWEVANGGIVNPQIISMAKTLGLATMPPMSPTPAYIETILLNHGPLWTNGARHIVIIAGIDRVKKTFLVYDPWPPGRGKLDWRPYRWYYNSSSASSRDTGAGVQAVFLFNP